MRYRLPAGAVESGSRWYVLHLHYVVALRPDASGGEFNVAAATDGRYTASTIFTVRRSHGRLETTADDVGMIGGHVRATSDALVREVRFENFLAYGGIRPGLNELRFELTSNAVPMVRYVHILPDTSIELTRRGPPAIRVELHAPGRPLEVGKRTAVEFVVLHLRGQPVASAHVSVRGPANAIRVSPARKSLHWGTLAPLHGHFSITPTRPGRLAVSVDATAALASSHAVTTLSVSPVAGSGSRAWLWVLAAVALVVVAAAAVASFRLRGSQP